MPGIPQSQHTDLYVSLVLKPFPLSRCALMRDNRLDGVVISRFILNLRVASRSHGATTITSMPPSQSLDIRFCSRDLGVLEDMGAPVGFVGDEGLEEDEEELRIEGRS